MKCSVPNCASKCKDRKGKSFFRFPKDTILRKKWIEAIGRLDYVPKDNNVICEDHFIESDFNNDLKTVCRIKRGAVPSINIPKPEEISTLAVSVSKNKLVRPPALQIKTNVVPAYLPNQHTKITMPAEIRAVAVDVLKNELVRPPALQINTNVAPAYLPNQHTKITMPAEVRAVAVDVLKNELVRPPALQMNTNVAPAYLPNQHAKITMPEEIRAVAADVSKKELIRPSALQPIKKDVVPAYLPIQHADIIIEESCETVINQETRRPLNSNKMKCEVFCCPNKRRKTRGKSFFRFPRDKETADLWLREIGREGAVINDNRFVCEDHFEESYIFQWKDRKVIDKEATPFHDYRACPICSDPNKKEEDIHPGRRKREKPEKPKKVKSNRKKVKSNRKNPCSSGFKSDNFVLDASQDFFKEEMEIDETITSLEITPLSYMDIPANNLEVNEDTESALKTSQDFMDTSLTEYQNVDILAEAEMEIKQAETAKENKIAEVIVENKSNLLSNNFLDPDIVECSAGSTESESINIMERVKAICRICLANYFKGQSIFLIYKKKYLPHIVYNLVGNLPTRDDELPAMICFTCADLLLQAEAARKRCISSDKFLRKELQKKKNEMESSEIIEPQNEDLNQNTEPNENNVTSAQTTANSFIPNKQSSVSVAKEHNYINFGNKKEKIKEIKVKKPKTLKIEDLLNIIEERLEGEENQNKTEDSPNVKDENTDVTEYVPNVKEEPFLEAQYLDDADVVYEELFSETNVQYKEDVELSPDSTNPDPLGMGIILPELFLCTVCSRKIPSLRAFRRHQRYHNSENFRCPICPEELTPQTIKDHLYTHKEREELICGDCGKKFDDIVDLYNHIITHARAYRKLLYIHECEICQKKTPSLASHLNHMKRRHNIQVQKPFQCNKCGIRFTAKLGLQRHEDNIHNLENRMNREKKFLCSTCGRKFFTKGTLQVHIRSHTGERPYKCKYCDKTFSQINSVTVHTYIHTGEKPFICSVCGKRFKQYSHYDYHMLIHADKRPHVCKICNRAFRVRGTLNTHMKIHGDRPFRCESCDKGYPERSGLKKHMKKHHSNDWHIQIPAPKEEELIVV